MEELRAHVAALHQQEGGLLRNNDGGGGVGGYPCESCSFVAPSEESWRRHNFMDHIESKCGAVGGGGEEAAGTHRLKLEQEESTNSQRYQCSRCMFVTHHVEYLGRKR